MRSLSRQLALLGAFLAVLAGTAATARADGDPASDFLLSQSTFLSPFDGHVSKVEAANLVRMLAQAKKQGFTLKVAVIVTRYDLGAVPVLFGQPKTYAKFLGEEDFYYWKSELLVVMPSGYGIYKANKLPPADRAAIAALPRPAAADGTTLVLAAEQAVRALAKLHGVTLTTSSGPVAKPSSSTTRDRALIAAGGGMVLVLVVALGFFLRRRRRA